ncbi:MAG: hypothetical protein ACLQGP_21895 [Isosphaeraceae bacterium]
MEQSIERRLRADRHRTKDSQNPQIPAAEVALVRATTLDAVRAERDGRERPVALGFDQK